MWDSLHPTINEHTCLLSIIHNFACFPTRTNIIFEITITTYCTHARILCEWSHRYSLICVFFFFSFHWIRLLFNYSNYCFSCPMICIHKTHSIQFHTTFFHSYRCSRLILAIFLLEIRNDFMHTYFINAKTKYSSRTL